MEVLRSVSVLRAVAAPHMAALEAEPEMHPRRAHLQALLAPLRCARTNVAHLIEMRALRRHFVLPPVFAGCQMFVLLALGESAMATPVDASAFLTAGATTVPYSSIERMTLS